MASNGKKKTTFAKMNREAAVRERRVAKQHKKEARKQEASEGTGGGPPIDFEKPEDLSHLDREIRI
jgi:hypothetical protein